ncbi:hypothetical protein FRC06_009620 [Ceratobasidium sp. 370]|nr:hypothetical protein FRC06_009620 [Ceratobasidium sp. 370]
MSECNADPHNFPDPDTLDDEALSQLLIVETEKQTTWPPDAWQVRVAVAIIRGRNVLLIAGTGFGKSITFVMAPFRAEEEDNWLKAVAMNRNTDFSMVKEGILHGDYQVVVLSPESFSQTNKLRQVALSKDLEDWFHITVIDEGHCIHTWGPQFCVMYDWCSDMRGYMPPGSPVVVATATFTAEIESKLISKLDMCHNLLTENLENLQYGVFLMSGGAKSYQEVCHFFPSRGLLHHTVIFVDSLPDAHGIVDALRTHLDLKGDDMLVQPYHSLRAEQGKLDAAWEFAGDECHALVTSEVLTMGANFSDIELVLLFGAPEDTMALVQCGGWAGRNRTMKARVVMMVTLDQYAKAKRICVGLTSEATGQGDTVEVVKTEPDTDEVDLGDPLGDVVPEGNESDARSEQDEVGGTQNPCEQPTAPGLRHKSSKSSKSKRRMKIGCSKAMDVHVACFITTESCRTRILDEVFRNLAHKPCEEVGGCDNCVKKGMELDELNAPDPYAAGRAIKREQTEREFILVEPQRKTGPTNRTDAELEKVKMALEGWRRETFEAECELQDLELEDIMTDKVLAVIARTRAVDNVESLDRLELLWPSRGCWGQAVVEVIQQQLQELHVSSEKKWAAQWDSCEGTHQGSSDFWSSKQTFGPMEHRELTQYESFRPSIAGDSGRKHRAQQPAKHPEFGVKSLRKKVVDMGGGEAKRMNVTGKEDMDVDAGGGKGKGQAYICNLHPALEVLSELPE